jgi:hypothetical protein
MRLAHVTPPACSGCFQQKLTKRHVDFDVAYDGPSMMNPQGGHQPIDDLILCEDCLRTAGVLVGLGDVEAMEAEVAMHRSATDLAESRADAAESRLAAMETALEVLRLNVQPAPPAQGGQRTKNQTAKPKAV